MKTNLHLCLLIGLAACGSVETSASKDLPTIETVAPDHGSVVGGTQVTLTGTNFGSPGEFGTTLVLVGGHVASDVNVVSDTQLTFKAPAGELEGETVEITVSNGNGFGTKSAAFTYNYKPVILSITPTIGKGAGGTMVTITGRGFMTGDTPTVTLAGGTATNVTVVDDKTITATTGPVPMNTKAFTPLDVVVQNANGASTLQGAFQVTRQGLLVLERRGLNRIYHVDSTGNVARIAMGVRQLRGCALNPANGKLYSMSQNISTGAPELVTFDPLTGSITTIGPTLDAGNVQKWISSLTFVGTTLYGVDSGNRSPASRRLVQINLTTGAVTVVGAAAMPISNSNAIALKDAATLWFVDVLNQSLDTIAIASSTLSTGLPLTGGDNATSAGMVSVGGTLYLVERTSPAQVFTVNTSNGNMTHLTTFEDAFLPHGLCETPPTF